MTDLDFDFSGINRLAIDLGELPRKTISNVRKAIEVSARNIKDDWREEAEQANPLRARRYPGAIDYDLNLTTDGQISAEIGPNLHKPQGSFGFLEDAPGGVRAAPQGNARRALKANEDDFVRGIVKATEDLL